VAFAADGHHARRGREWRRLQWRRGGPGAFLQNGLASPAPLSADYSYAGSVNVASFVLRRCPIVAKTAIPTGGAAEMADIAIRGDLMVLNRDQKLFPHFGQAGTAVFAVEEVEYGGHDRTPSFGITTLSFLSGCKGDLDHTRLGDSSKGIPGRSQFRICGKSGSGSRGAKPTRLTRSGHPDWARFAIATIKSVHLGKVEGAGGRVNASIFLHLWISSGVANHVVCAGS
jgi:hypothetical protein